MRSTDYETMYMRSKHPSLCTLLFVCVSRSVVGLWSSVVLNSLVVGGRFGAVKDFACCVHVFVIIWEARSSSFTEIRNQPEDGFE